MQPNPPQTIQTRRFGQLQFLNEFINYLEDLLMNAQFCLREIAGTYLIERAIPNMGSRLLPEKGTVLLSEQGSSTHYILSVVCNNQSMKT